MRPFLVTDQQAGKLPRWALWLLCLLYIVPGFPGRDPWRTDDAAGFGVAWSMAGGGPAQWLMPAIAGEPVTDEGPLPFWFGALAIRALPWLPGHQAMQIAAMLALGLMFFALWYASYHLARRPGVQPDDPFDAQATPIDFGRAVADSTLLILMATIGLIARLHETSAESAQVVWVAVFLYGASIAPARPLGAGAIAGLAIGASVLTRGWLPAAALGLAAIGLPLVARPYRLVARRWLGACLPVALLAAFSWPIALAVADLPGAREHLDLWWAWNRTQFLGLRADGLAYYLRNLPWYFWPAWPIAAWALWRWRTRLDEPAVAVPLVTAALLALAMLAGSRTPESQIPLAAAPIAMLAAIGLPTLRRSVTSLIDWFAVMTYTVIGLIFWAYWLALLTGQPARMAAKAAALSPGYVPQDTAGALALGVAASLAWLALVRWRIARHRPRLWRPVALSCGGLVLAWVLLMSLWLPAFNQRNTYRELGQSIARSLPADYGCVGTRHLGRAQRATLHYFGGLRFGGDDCAWLLAQETGPLARSAPTSDAQWTFHWQGARPRDSEEILRLYRRSR